MQNCILRCLVNNKQSLITIGFLFAFFVLKSQNLPPIQYFSPKQYNASNQNWDISQSSDKYIYVANSKGLLEFNGANWNLYNSPNETVIRSVHVLGDKIYTGCYMEFGYWQKTQIGDLQYTSLSSKIKKKLLEDEQFWNIESLGNWLLFQSLDRIYIYNTLDKTFNIIDSEESILKMFKVKNAIYFQDKTKGLFAFENSKPKLISNAPEIINDIVVGFFPIEEHFIVITQNKGIYQLKGNQITKFSDVLDSFSVYSSLMLNDNSIIVGTISNGIIQLNTNGEIVNTIKQENGLGNNTILSVFEDVDKNLWLGMDNGVSCINIDSPFLIFNDNKGGLGTVYTSVVYRNRLYLGTNQGLFYKDEKSHDLTFVENTKGQVWCLKVIDNQLFCGHNRGTFIIEDNIARRIADIDGTWDILTVKNNPNLLLQGNYNGLNVLENQNGKWVFRNKINGFNNSSRFLVFINNNQVLVNHEYKGVFKIDIKKDFSSISKVQKLNFLGNGLFSSVAKHNNKIYYASKKGVFVSDQENFNLKKDTILSNLFKKQGYASGKLVSDSKTNTLWIFTQKGINYIKPGKLSNDPDITFIPLSNTLRDNISGYESVSSISASKFILGTSRGYKILDISKFEARAYTVHINEIKLNPLSGQTKLINISENGLFKNKQNNLEFSYSIAEYDKYLEAEYATKLEGFYENWSDWSNQSNVSYKNLPPGDYIFKVKARVGDKNVEDAVVYSFSIEKPWYLSSSMIVVYFILGIIIVLLVNYFYKLYYKKQKAKLLLKTQRELELKDLENKQHLMKLNNEKLKNEIESKNRELAVSTMSLIKKNEFLNTIKKELSEKVEDSNLKPVIKIIDKNINNKDDWKLFEEAFNNADKDFLKKIKSIHPKLTSNDLRLCAYLRLNLSSKEIAPLLNISPRSVEVKRYRLRKKMDLPHKTNLTDYILEL